MTDRTKQTALEKALRAMFGALRARPVPDRVMSVVEQLDAAEAPRLNKAKRG